VRFLLQFCCSGKRRERNCTVLYCTPTFCIICVSSYGLAVFSTIMTTYSVHAIPDWFVSALCLLMSAAHNCIVVKQLSHSQLVGQTRIRSSRYSENVMDRISSTGLRTVGNTCASISLGPPHEFVRCSLLIESGLILF
jgi:hypothetical protein